jgi:hypothetical protein
MDVVWADVNNDGHLDGLLASRASCNGLALFFGDIRPYREMLFFENQVNVAPEWAACDKQT